MMRRQLLGLLLCGISLGVLADPIAVDSAEFGIFDASDPREIVFQPTNVIPHREGQRYGWVIEVRTQKRSLSVREEYLLPTAATEAGATLGPAGGTIPLPRRSQVSQRQLVPVDGVIIGEWTIGPGEPTGKRHLQVIVEGRVAGSFDYEVK
jgi:hypothetical protein